MPQKKITMPRKPEWSDMEWQVRNWYWWTWLSGDHIVEQAVHSIDKGTWALGDKPPKPPASTPELPKRVTDLLSFDSWVQGLWGLHEQPTSTFRTTSIKLEQMEQVIELLTEVAKLLTPTVVPLRAVGNVEIPAADVKAAHEATELEPV